MAAVGTESSEKLLGNKDLQELAEHINTKHRVSSLHFISFEELNLGVNVSWNARIHINVVVFTGCSTRTEGILGVVSNAVFHGQKYER